MPPTLADRVRHVWDAIREIELALATVSYEQFSANLLLRLAIERLLEIVCEASKYIPADVKAAEAQIPWQKITDFGNRLRHAYHELDAGIVWQITQQDLDPLTYHSRCRRRTIMTLNKRLGHERAAAE